MVIQILWESGELMTSQGRLREFTSEVKLKMSIKNIKAVGNASRLHKKKKGRKYSEK